MIVAGVDVGSMTAEAVILNNGEIASWTIVPTGPRSAETATQAMELALSNAGFSWNDLGYTVATGYGRLIVPFAQQQITEISCHAKGAHWFFPNCRTILDMGGQDCKAINCDASGRVRRFVMNDKCAAGTGRALEVMAELLGVPLGEVGARSLDVEGEVPSISNVCVVFAKGEVVGLVRRGTPVNNVLAGLCEALAHRVCALLRTVDLEEEFAVTGGIANNIGVVRRVEEEINMKANICFEPQIVGALGAALFARELLSKEVLSSS